MNDIFLYNTLKNTHTLARAPGKTVVSDLCGLQAQFSRNPQISLRLRAGDYDENTWNDGFVKIWSHRGTIHVVRADELGLYLSAAGNSGPFRDGAWGMSQADQQKWAPFIQNEIANGNDARDGLKEACASAGMDEELAHRTFYGWGGLIKEMVWRGMITCSTGTDKRYSIPDKVEWLDRDDARRALVRRYFTTFGPATKRDCAAFFGWPAAELNPILGEILPELHETAFEGQKYYHSASLQEGEIPPCVLLPGFDQTLLAYKNRSRLIDKIHIRKAVNMAGIVFPVILLRGRVRARWKLDGDKIEVTPFERLLKKDEVNIRRTAKAELSVKTTEFLPHI